MNRTFCAVLFNLLFRVGGKDKDRTTDARDILVLALNQYEHRGGRTKISMDSKSFRMIARKAVPDAEYDAARDALLSNAWTSAQLHTFFAAYAREVQSNTPAVCARRNKFIGCMLTALTNASSGMAISDFTRSNAPTAVASALKTVKASLDAQVDSLGQLQHCSRQVLVWGALGVVHTKAHSAAQKAAAKAALDTATTSVQQLFPV